MDEKMWRLGLVTGRNYINIFILNIAGCTRLEENM